MHVITLAVDDLERALTFYRDGLGLATKGVVADGYEGSETEAAGAIVPFKLDGGLILSLYPRSELAKDARIPPTPPASGEFSHWTHRPRKIGGRRATRSSPRSRRDADRRGPRAAAGDLFRLLPRP